MYHFVVWIPQYLVSVLNHINGCCFTTFHTSKCDILHIIGVSEYFAFKIVQTDQKKKKNLNDYKTLYMACIKKCAYSPDRLYQIDFYH